MRHTRTCTHTHAHTDARARTNPSTADLTHTYLCPVSVSEYYATLRVLTEATAPEPSGAGFQSVLGNARSTG